MKVANSRVNSAQTPKRGLAPRKPHWTSTGWDTVECRISTNPGEPLKPLAEIASGGEMSRVMLALKVAVEENSAKTTRKTPPPAPSSSTKSTSASEAAPPKPSAKN